MSSTRKKVLVRLLDGTVVPGYLPLTGLGQDHASVDLLNLEGRLEVLPLSDVKSVAYVREFNRGDKLDPERLNRRTFLARPRQEGLWLRLTFVTGDQIEGLAAADRSLLDAAVQDAGVFFAPPDARSNTQRLFVPHAAVEALELLAVIVSPTQRALRAERVAGKEKAGQEPLFTDPADDQS